MHTILICDDDRDIVSALDIYLASEGYRTLKAYNGLEAIQAVERNEVHLILMDIMMPELDGIRATARLREGSNIPIILLTAKSEDADKILGLMRRRYTTARFADRIAAVRALMPDAFIGIDVIVGFPGETEEDFRTTYDFLAGLEPAFLHIFPFSERPGTPAVEMPGKVQASVATRRAAQLEALCAKLHAAFCARAVGSEDSVLFESTRRGGMMFGFTGNYRRVKAPYDKARVNTVCRVRLGAMDESHDLMGEIRD